MGEFVTEDDKKLVEIHDGICRSVEHEPGSQGPEDLNLLALPRVRVWLGLLSSKEQPTKGVERDS